MKRIVEDCLERNWKESNLMCRVVKQYWFPLSVKHKILSISFLIQEDWI